MRANVGRMFMEFGRGQACGWNVGRFRLVLLAGLRFALMPAIGSTVSAAEDRVDLPRDGQAPNTTAAPAAVDTSPVVARGEGLLIRTSELQSRLRRAAREMATPGRTLSAADEAKLSRRLLDQMIFTRLAASRATPQDRTRAQFESRAFIEGLQRRLGSAAALAQQLQTVGLTDAAFRAEKLAEALALAVSEREIRGSIHIPDAEIRKYYETNAERWKQPEQVRVAHLLLTTVNENGEPLPPLQIDAKKAQILKFRAQVQSGTNFSALIHGHSEDSSTRATGGEYTISRAQMDPDFESAAFALQPGQLSDVVKSSYGYHLIQGRERIPATNLPIATVTPDIRGVLTQREMELRMPDYADRLRREAKVEVISDQ